MKNHNVNHERWCLVRKYSEWGSMVKYTKIIQKRTLKDCLDYWYDTILDNPDTLSTYKIGFEDETGEFIAYN